MGKFQAGDRVRLSGHPYSCDDEGVYVRKYKYGDTLGKHVVRVTYGTNTTTLHFKRRELTLIDTRGRKSTKTKFKVGDRVRVKGGDIIGTIASRNCEGVMAIRYDGTGVGFEVWHDHELEPASSPSVKDFYNG